MTTVLWTALVVIALVVNIVLHEWMHVVALQGLGGDIRRAGIGLPLPPMVTLKPRGRRLWALTLSPWLLGAYVEPDHRSEHLVQRLGYRDKAWFAGAGVMVNFLIAAVLLAVNAVARPDPAWLLGAVSLAVAVLIWLLRKPITWALPLIGFPALALVGYSLWVSVGEPQGPVGMAVAVVTSDGSAALALAFGISLGVGLLNTIPIYPFDGGRVVDALVQKLFGKRAAAGFQLVTSVVAVALVVYVLGSDLWFLVTA